MYAMSAALVGTGMEHALVALVGTDMVLPLWKVALRSLARLGSSLSGWTSTTLEGGLAERGTLGLFVVCVLG